MSHTNRFLRLPEVRRRVGLSAATIWRLEQAGKFPRRIRIGATAVAWSEAELEKWAGRQIAARDANAPTGAGRHAKGRGRK